MHRFAARTSAIPCVAGSDLRDCDSTSAWRRRHLFLSFHDGRRFFGPRLVALLPKLREKYLASVSLDLGALTHASTIDSNNQPPTLRVSLPQGGRMLVWSNVRDVLPRTFSQYYMWSNDASGKQLAFDRWIDLHSHSLDAHVTGLGVSVDPRACDTEALTSASRVFDLFVHMDCVGEFLATLYASLRRIADKKKVKIGYVAPGHAYRSASAAQMGGWRENRSKTTWATLSNCTRRKLLDATRCDATFYSKLFGDSPWHRAAWWGRDA